MRHAIMRYALYGCKYAKFETLNCTFNAQRHAEGIYSYIIISPRHAVPKDDIPPGHCPASI